MSRIPAMRKGRVSRVVAGGLVAAAAWASALAGGAPPVPPAPAPSPYPPDPNALDEPAVAAAAPTPKAMQADPADPVDIAHGRRAYKDFCQKCHGLEMASPGPPFFDLRTFPKDAKARFVESVTHGKRAMPAWGTVLKPTEIESLWTYVSAAAPR